VMEDHAKNYEILSKKFLAFLSIWSLSRP
jgi:hypothetical protein